MASAEGFTGELSVLGTLARAWSALEGRVGRGVIHRMIVFGRLLVREQVRILEVRLVHLVALVA